MIDQDKMRALVAVLRKYKGTGFVVDDCHAAADAIDLLLAEVEAAAADKRDAERYRYLRSRPESVEPDRIDVVYWSALDESANEGEGLRGDALDAAIDAALAQRQGEGS